MAHTASTAREARVVRHRRLRKKIAGTAERPRLSVFRSLNQIYAQVVDDVRGHTMTSASSLEEASKEQKSSRRSKTETAKVVGGLVAKRARDLGVKEVTFDRGGFKYHGRVRALADAAREGGLQF